MVKEHTVNAGQVARIAIDDEPAEGTFASDLAEFVCKGCTVAAASKTNQLASVTDTVDSATQLAEKGAHLLESMVRVMISAGDDPFAEAGL